MGGMIMMLLAFVQRVSQDAGACALFPAYVIDVVMQESPEVMIPFLRREHQKRGRRVACSHTWAMSVAFVVAWLSWELKNRSRRKHRTNSGTSAELWHCS